MTPSVQERESAALASIEEQEAKLPAIEEKSAAKPRIEKLIGSIDLSSTESIISFGMEAQQPLVKLTGEILADARARDTGKVGEILNDAVAKMRGLDFNLAKKGDEVGFLGKLLGKLPPIVRFIQSFEAVDGHMDVIKDGLHDRHTAMLEEVKLADVKYETLLDYYHDLGEHVSAVDTLLERVDTEIIPAEEKKALEADDRNVGAQKLSDLRAARETLSNKLHDLRLTRQAVMQAIPTVRTKQAADKALAEKLYSMIVNGIPLWKLNVANALSIQRTKEAGEVAKAVSDFANEQLKATARTAREANKLALDQASRGIYDMEAIQVAHEETIGMIEDTLAIRAAAEERRRQEVATLQAQEAELRNTLRKAQ